MIIPPPSIHHLSIPGHINNTLNVKLNLSFIIWLFFILFFTNKCLSILAGLSAASLKIQLSKKDFLYWKMVLHTVAYFSISWPPLMQHIFQQNEQGFLNLSDRNCLLGRGKIWWHLFTFYLLFIVSPVKKTLHTKYKDLFSQNSHGIFRSNYRHSIS